MSFLNLDVKDPHVHSTCLAILANISPGLRALHPYAVRKLFDLFDGVSRQFRKVGRDGRRLSDPASDIVETDQDILADLLRVILDVINACLLSGPQHNPELLYIILREQDHFSAYKAEFPRLAENIEMVASYFRKRIEEAQLDNPSAQEVLQIIERFVRQFPTAKLKVPDKDAVQRDRKLRRLL